ncbi:MAG: DEAD/DEAH box helicase, partial [Opitutae bacterium]
MAEPPSAPRTKLTGICPPAHAHALAKLLQRHPAPVWLVVHEDAKQADALAEDLALFHHAHKSSARLEILNFPEAQTENKEMREAFTAASDRLSVLSRLRSLRPSSSLPAPRSPLIILATPAALLQPVPPLIDFAERETELQRGAGLPFPALLKLLAGYDYDAEAVCEAPGQYAVRGGIVDVYPITAHQPYRLDYFGDTLEDIRTLDPVSQRSGEAVDRITLTAAPKLHAAGAQSTLLEYLNPATHAALLEPKSLEELFDMLSPETGRAGTSAVAKAMADEPLPAESAVARNGVRALPFLARLPQACAQLFGVSDLDLASELFDSATTEETWDTESLSHHRTYPEDHQLAHERLQAEEDGRRQFLEKVAAWRKEGFAVDFVISKEGEEQRVRELLAEHPALKKIQPRYLRGALNEGFRVTFRGGRARPLGAPPPVPGGPSGPALPKGLVVVSETEIFGRRRQRRAAPKRTIAAASAVDQLLDFSELVEGDFVVHLQHGIAHYRGLTKLDTRDGTREVISLEFDDQVTLHVPLQESHLVSRYVGLTKTKPQLGRIGSGRWEKARQAAEHATIDLAAELLQIQAQREAQPGHAFAEDNVWQKEFEAAFPFTETRDQAKAITDMKVDMERTRPMDRLVCGDVGFGKTEVAIRGAFKAVMGGRQVAVLVPTTVLAQQHLNTFRERMAGYPVAVEMLSRFRTRKEQAGILAALAEGKVDIVIGTHRLVQADVKFKDLGLVIVDEEQRFGVKHKEV